MACLSPSPSGRRLSELLEEKQEPFFLDLHLLEKGCSARLLDGYDTVLCWPAAGNDAASVLKRLTSKKKKATAATAASTRSKKQQPGKGTGLLRLLLSQILHGKAANRKPAALQFSDSFKKAASSPCSKNLDAVKTDVVVDRDEEMEYSDSDDDEKQLSPISVLEHPFESSPVHNQIKCSKTQGSPKNAMAILRELLEAAYSPALLAQLLAKSEDLILDHGGDDNFYYNCTSTKNGRDENDKAAAEAASATTSAAYWDTHRAELARVSELVASEVPRSRLDAADVEPERRDVGADVEAAVLESLLQELVVDLGSYC